PGLPPRVLDESAGVPLDPLVRIAELEEGPHDAHVSVGGPRRDGPGVAALAYILRPPLVERDVALVIAPCQDLGHEHGVLLDRAAGGVLLVLRQVRFDGAPYGGPGLLCFWDGFRNDGVVPPPGGFPGRSHRLGVLPGPAPGRPPAEGPGQGSCGEDGARTPRPLL